MSLKELINSDKEISKLHAEWVLDTDNIAEECTNDTLKAALIRERTRDFIDELFTKLKGKKI